MSSISMFMSNLTRWTLLSRPLISNSTVLASIRCSYSTKDSVFFDRVRKYILTEFEETNSEVFNQLKKNYQKPDDLNWSELRSKLIKEHPKTYNQFNFEVQFMQHLLKVGDRDDVIIKSFTDYVKQLLTSQGNKVVQCHLIRFILLMEKNPDVDYLMNALEEISKDEFFIKYPVVGKAWAEFAKLSPAACRRAIDFARTNLVFQHDALVGLLVRCLQFNMFDEAENLLTIYQERKIGDAVATEWMSSMSKTEIEKVNDEFHRFVQILNSKRYLFQKTMLPLVENFLRSCGYHFTGSTIKDEACKKCGTKLETIRTDELVKLASAVEQRLVNKHGQIYIVSTPKEVEDFYRFMGSHSSAPFDLVIDGLNVSYYNTSRAVQEDKKTNSLSIKNLGLVESLYETMQLNNIFERFEKILVIGRKHMASWPSIKQLKTEHPGKIWVYLLDNKSEDDVFTIYAATRSPTTFIWTADFLRQYRELLGPENGNLFEKWKYCRQVRFVPGSKRRLEFPSGVDYICQSNDKGRYHFPINMNVRVDKEERISAHWLCISRSKT